MLSTTSDLHGRLLRLSEPIAEILRRTQYTPQESSKVSTKDILLSLLPNTSSSRLTNEESIKSLALACALLASSRSSTHELLSWIPESLSVAGESAFCEISRDCFSDFPSNSNAEDSEKIELLPIVLPELKDRIEKSSLGKGSDAEDVSAAMARTPVGYAILAAHQLRWFVTQVEKPNLVKFCNLVVPCALTALDHWSPEVKGQGMISFIHLAKNVSSGDLGSYGDVVLDACCQNIASDDEIWIHVVELSVLLVTKIHPNNPRSPWYERIMNEMLGHLERQPRNKERCIAWLRFVEPLLNALGLFLLAHFRRIFPLFFQWMHSDDAETVLLVLERLETIVRLTWIRNSPVIPRLVDELVSLYKESSMRKDRDDIRPLILRILMLLRQCKSLQFESAWSQYQEDPNLSTVSQHIYGLVQVDLKSVCLT
ncbi:Armadillo-type fold [Arabidopsis suecica]|uniref:Armadillo-type fold n=1 Tax=Arabidopsis suecica TaxID=45249 RepID=A0A8T2ANC4_ARASU|nr:Armadillo-type fold [Arabidopsis suecica]